MQLGAGAHPLGVEVSLPEKADIPVREGEEGSWVLVKPEGRQGTVVGG